MKTIPSVILILLTTAAASAAQEDSLPVILFGKPFHGQFIELQKLDKSITGTVLTDHREAGQFTIHTASPPEKNPLKLELLKGRRYAFPDCFVSALDAETLYANVRRYTGIRFADVLGMRPFRATVLDQGIGPHVSSIILRESGGRLLHLQILNHNINDRDTALLMRVGMAFEFPAIIQDFALTAEARAEKAKPKSRMDEVLKRYIGEWKGRTDAISYATLRMRCHWQSEGAGIWREITYEHDGDAVAPLPDITRMSYDSDAGCYLVWYPHEVSRLKFRVKWDEKTQTFTTYLPGDDAGVDRYNEATFTDETHISWRTCSKKPDGSVQVLTTGSYERVRADPDPPVIPSPLRPVGLRQGLADDSSKLPTPIQSAMVHLPEIPERMIRPEYKPDPNRADVPVVDSPASAPVIGVVADTLVGVASSEPFRAELVSCHVSRHEVSLSLLHCSGHLQNISESRPHIGTTQEANALARLKTGVVYEFPHCLKSPGTEPATRGVSAELNALASLVGTWEEAVYERDGTHVTRPSLVSYFWSADRTFLWRQRGEEGRGTLHRLYFNPSKKVYQLSPVHQKAETAKWTGTWEEDSRTLTLSHDFAHAEYGPKREELSYAIQSDSMIKWGQRLLSKEGTIARAESGLLLRVKK